MTKCEQTKRWFLVRLSINVFMCCGLRFLDFVGIGKICGLYICLLRFTGRDSGTRDQKCVSSKLVNAWVRTILGSPLTSRVGMLAAEFMFCFCVACCSLFAAPPTIESVWPPVGQRGTEFQLKIVGSGLTTSKHLVFYSPHLICKSVQANSDYEVVATIVAAQNCRLGNEPFRLLSVEGFSEMRTVRITPFPIDVQELSAKASEKPASRRGGRNGGPGGAEGGVAPATSS